MHELTRICFLVFVRVRIAIKQYATIIDVKSEYIWVILEWVCLIHGVATARLHRGA